MKIPAAPPGTGPAGRQLWRSVMAAYTLSVLEDVLLRQATRVIDQVAELDARLVVEGLIVAGRAGESKAHPALPEVRQQRLVLARLMAGLRLPLDESSPRSQHRGIRGVYSTGVVS